MVCRGYALSPQLLPDGRMQRQYMERLELLSGEHMPEDEEELEKEVALRPGAVV